jgi:hypothetical protein
MKMPKFILRVGGQDFVVPHNRGVAAVMTLLSDAVPVRDRLHEDPPAIELVYDDDPSVTTMLTEVSVRKIPRNVVWRRKNKEGQVEVVRPVAKAPKALRNGLSASRLADSRKAKQLGNSRAPLQLEF